MDKQVAILLKYYRQYGSYCLLHETH